MIKSLGIKLQVTITENSETITPESSFKTVEWGKKFYFYRPLTVIEANNEYKKIKKLVSAELKSYDYVKDFKIIDSKLFKVKEVDKEFKEKKIKQLEKRRKEDLKELKKLKEVEKLEK